MIEAFPLRKEKRKWIPRPTLVQAYLFFHDRVVDYIIPPKVEDAPASSEATPDPSHAEELLEAIIRYVQLVEINLDTEDDPQIIFETLNARGAPLAPSDLVRNYVFLHATRRGEDVVHLYNSYWRQFDEAPDTARRSRTKSFWREPERQGRLLVNRLDLLLFHFLSSQLGSEFKLSHIFPAFREWWDRPGAPPRSDPDLEVLKAASGVFSQLLLAEGDGPLAPFARALKTLDVSTVFPLVLYVCERQPTILDTDFRGILADLESYLIRRAICALTPKNYNRVLLALVKQLRGESQLSRDLFQSALLSLEGDSSRWPDDPSFLEAFVTKPAYTHLGPARTAYILEAIEQQISTSKQENIQVLSALTVEHVWPQNPRDGAWPPPPMTPDGKPDFAASIHRRTLIEGFGNLTLLTQPLNSSVSNGPYSDKQPALIRESRLRLNTYFQDVPPEASWDEVQITKRAEVLVQSALARWPYPVAKK